MSDTSLDGVMPDIFHKKGPASLIIWLDNRPYRTSSGHLVSLDDCKFVARVLGRAHRDISRVLSLEGEYVPPLSNRLTPEQKRLSLYYGSKLSLAHLDQFNECLLRLNRDLSL